MRGGLIYTKARLTKPLGDIAEGRNTLSIASFLLAATVLFVARITTKTKQMSLPGSSAISSSSSSALPTNEPSSLSRCPPDTVNLNASMQSQASIRSERPTSIVSVGNRSTINIYFNQSASKNDLISGEFLQHFVSAGEQCNVNIYLSHQPELQNTLQEALPTPVSEVKPTKNLNASKASFKDTQSKCKQGRCDVTSRESISPAKHSCTTGSGATNEEYQSSPCANQVKSTNDEHPISESIASKTANRRGSRVGCSAPIGELNKGINPSNVHPYGKLEKVGSDGQKAVPKTDSSTVTDKELPDRNTMKLSETPSKKRVHPPAEPNDQETSHLAKRANLQMHLEPLEESKAAEAEPSEPQFYDAKSEEAERASVESPCQTNQDLRLADKKTSRNRSSYSTRSHERTADDDLALLWKNPSFKKQRLGTLMCGNHEVVLLVEDLKSLWYDTASEGYVTDSALSAILHVRLKRDRVEHVSPDIVQQLLAGHELERFAAEELESKLKADQIVFPYLINSNHWVASIIDTKASRIWFVDSCNPLVNLGNEKFIALVKNLERYTTKLGFSDLSNWDAPLFYENRVQNDSHNCGIWIAVAASAFVQSKKGDFDPQEHMIDPTRISDYRKNLFKDVVSIVCDKELWKAALEEARRVELESMESDVSILQDSPSAAGLEKSSFESEKLIDESHKTQHVPISCENDECPDVEGPV